MEPHGDAAAGTQRPYCTFRPYLGCTPCGLAGHRSCPGVASCREANPSVSRSPPTCAEAPAASRSTPPGRQAGWRPAGRLPHLRPVAGAGDADGLLAVAGGVGAPGVDRGLLAGDGGRRAAARSQPHLHALGRVARLRPRGRELLKIADQGPGLAGLLEQPVRPMARPARTAKTAMISRVAWPGRRLSACSAAA